MAEFVLDIAKQSTGGVQDFERRLNEMEADFSIELVNTIYATVTRMLPDYFKKSAAASEEQSNSHFKGGKMLDDEPEKPLHSTRHNSMKEDRRGGALTEEDKFD